jgi:hypothetical protein
LQSFFYSKKSRSRSPVSDKILIQWGMTKLNLPQLVHPAGDLPIVVEAVDDGPIVVDTYAGPVRVEWDPEASVTALGHFAFLSNT